VSVKAETAVEDLMSVQDLQIERADEVLGSSWKEKKDDGWTELT
jgi:hypothetical protein